MDIFIVLFLPKLLQIDFLVLAEDFRSARKRNGGTGSALLKAAIAHYPPNTVFIGETEAPTGDPARDEMILRRLGFYARNAGMP